MEFHDKLAIFSFILILLILVYLFNRLKRKKIVNLISGEYVNIYLANQADPLRFNPEWVPEIFSKGVSSVTDPYEAIRCQNCDFYEFIMGDKWPKTLSCKKCKELCFTIISDPKDLIVCIVSGSSPFENKNKLKQIADINDEHALHCQECGKDKYFLEFDELGFAYFFICDSCKAGCYAIIDAK